MGFVWMGDDEDQELAQAPAFSAESNNYENIYPYVNKDGVLYIPQDNLFFGSLKSLGTQKIKKLYCDSATSCIIIFVTGKLNCLDHTEGVLGGHLSREERFNYFFTVASQCFQSEVCIFAAGANPGNRFTNRAGHWDYTSLRNASQTAGWIASLYNKKSFCGGTSSGLKCIQSAMRFGEITMSDEHCRIYDNNMDCMGIDLSRLDVTNVQTDFLPTPNNTKRYPCVSNLREDVAEQRDPTGGLQTLFCIFGDPNVVRSLFSPFTKQEKDTLVSRARQSNFQAVADMRDEDILKYYSTTPCCEVPWFASTIREAARYVLHYKK